MKVSCTILIAFLLLALASNCHKSDDHDDDIIPGAPTDSILYTDFVPDLELRCTPDTTIDDYGNKLLKGEFIYGLDINNDKIGDFLIVGRQWSELGQRSMSDSAFIEGLNGNSYIGYKKPSGSCWCPCNSATQAEGAVIARNLIDGWVQRVIIHAFINGLSCSWRYYGEENQYLPVWLHLNNEVYYGWIRASAVSNTMVGDSYGMEFTVYDCAINLRNGKPIYAGQIH